MSTNVIDPLSVMFGGAAMAARKKLTGSTGSDDTSKADETNSVMIDSDSSDFDGVVQQSPIGSLPAIPHSYGGVFTAAGTGALSGVQTDKLSGGWWDGTVAAAGKGPVLELQAINDDARQRLTKTVLDTLKSAFKTYDPKEGYEAEAAQDLLAVVAETATKEWLLGSSAGGLSEGEDSEEDAVDEVMVRRAGDLAADLIVLDDVESPGSKSALYLNLFTHMANLSTASSAAAAAIEASDEEETAAVAGVGEVMSVTQVADGEMAEAAIELASAASQPDEDASILSFSMAAVTVSVLEDAALRVAEAVASAYLSRVREGASAPVKRQAVAAVAASGKRMSRVAQAQAERARKTAVLAASTASKVVRYALELHPRLKSTRSLEKFRNEVKLQNWINTNYRDVVAMYEDWHDLMGLDEAGDIVQRRINICRHSELDRVKGLKLVMSMFLELADVIVPIAQSALSNFKNFASWLLVTLIGRSLGLVYRGIRESMGSNNGDIQKPSFV